MTSASVTAQYKYSETAYRWVDWRLLSTSSVLSKLYYAACYKLLDESNENDFVPDLTAPGVVPSVHLPSSSQ